MKTVTALFASAAFAIAGPGLMPTTARADTVDPSLPTQLPRTAIPHHYAITVTPHAARLTFDGQAAIDLDVVTATTALTFNAADLNISKASLRSVKGGASVVGRVTIDPKTETATVIFPSSVSAGAYRLDLAYSGKINTQANGLFALDYKNLEGKDARSLFTQFEAADARRFMPSWDEPDYKATFDLTARVPAGEMAVSNMPAASSRALPGGLKEVRFQQTPTMSSYLLFFATGDFDRIAKPSGEREAGIVMSRGNGPKAQLALDSEAQILPYYNDYFGTPYPLPKLDNVAGPGQSQFFGAMENWGAIFTFERILLNDPAITTEADRQAIFGVEAHEMAHQWFGDLVTMGWWSDLWLNEGFASWMANKANQHFHPDWSAEIDHVGAREQAMALDAFKSTHPIVQDVRTVEQANQAFDDITYEKGESVLSMLEGFAGPDVWRDGIRRYIAKHAYQNTRTDDLWTAQEAAGARGLREVARDFIDQPGIPLIEVGPARCVGGQTVTSFRQGQFSNDQRDQVSASPRQWRVPIRASAGGAAVSIVTAGRDTTAQLPGCGPLLINAGQTGYYRTLYRAEQKPALVSAFVAWPAVDQFGVMKDQIALAQAGYQPMGFALDLLNLVPPGSNGKLVQEAVTRWSAIYDQFNGDPATQRLIASRVTRTYGPRLQALGFVPKSGESPTDTLLRPTLIATLGKLRDPAVVIEANRLFAAWQQNPEAIEGSLKQSWLGVVARNADARTWDILHAKAVAAKGAVERTALYNLLGVTSDQDLARRALELSLSNEPGKTVSAGMISSVAGRNSRMAVDFVLAHLSQVNQLIDISGRSRFMQRLSASSDDPALIPILENYARSNLAATDRAPVDQAIDRIRFRSAQAGRIKAETAQWLAAHPA